MHTLDGPSKGGLAASPGSLAPHRRRPPWGRCWALAAAQDQLQTRTRHGHRARTRSYSHAQLRACAWECATHLRLLCRGGRLDPRDGRGARGARGARRQGILAAGPGPHRQGAARGALARPGPAGSPGACWPSPDTVASSRSPSAALKGRDRQANRRARIRNVVGRIVTVQS